MRQLGLMLILLAAGCARAQEGPRVAITPTATPAAAATPLEKLLANLIEQTTQTTRYDPAYTKLAYPNGDVPLDRGVCADVGKARDQDPEAADD